MFSVLGEVSDSRPLLPATHVHHAAQHDFFAIINIAAKPIPYTRVPFPFAGVEGGAPPQAGWPLGAGTRRSWNRRVYNNNIRNLLPRDARVLPPSSLRAEPQEGGVGVARQDACRVARDTRKKGRLHNRVSRAPSGSKEAAVE
mgnify:CR=1 FL=1